MLWLRVAIAILFAAALSLPLFPRHSTETKHLTYTPAWPAKGGMDQDTWNHPPKRLRDWRDFVDHLTSAMSRHRNIASFEIYNEEDFKQWWEGTSADYNRVLAQGATEIRHFKPSLQILFGGMVRPDTNWIEQACKTFGNARNFDVIPFHAYPETWTPKGVDVENYLDQYGDFLAAVDRACGPKPIWINEAGFATMPPKTELDQANWWARALATFGAAPRVDEIGIYQIRDAAKDKTVIGGDAANYYFGLLRHDRTKKLAFQTIRALAPLLEDEPLLPADSELRSAVIAGVAGRLYSHLFVRAVGSQVVFVWDKTSDPTLRLQLSRPGSSVMEIKLDGHLIPYESFRDNCLDRVHLTPGLVRVFEIAPR